MYKWGNSTTRKCYAALSRKARTRRVLRDPALTVRTIAKRAEQDHWAWPPGFTVGGGTSPSSSDPNTGSSRRPRQLP